jgi:hypothetical protein
MRRLILASATILFALGAVEGIAYWWMHPKPAGLGEPVLVYRPGAVKELSVVSERVVREEPVSCAPAHYRQLFISDRQRTTDNSSLPPSFKIQNQQSAIGNRKYLPLTSLSSFPTRLVQRRGLTPSMCPKPSQCRSFWHTHPEKCYHYARDGKCECQR